MKERESKELEEVLSAVSKFLRDIKEPLKELLEMLLSGMSGEKLGDDISKFYKKLKDAEMPDEVINEMVKRYFEERVKASSVLSAIPRILSGWGGPREAKEKEENEARAHHHAGSWIHHPHHHLPKEERENEARGR